MLWSALKTLNKLSSIAIEDGYIEIIVIIGHYQVTHIIYFDTNGIIYKIAMSNGSQMRSFIIEHLNGMVNI